MNQLSSLFGHRSDGTAPAAGQDKEEEETWRARMGVFMYPMVAYVLVAAAFISLSPGWPTAARIRVMVFGLGAIWTMLWASFAFSGKAYERRIHAINFAYFIVFMSFGLFLFPALGIGNPVGGEPMGIVSGCVNGPSASELVRCEPRVRLTQSGVEEGLPRAGQGTQLPAVPARNQWLLNIGGTISPQGECSLDRRSAGESSDNRCRPGSIYNRVYVSGGLVVPLSFVIIALTGGAISLSRRVPEIQMQSERSDKWVVVKPTLAPHEAREKLIFQIVQFISAPLVGIVAYQIIGPETEATSAGLAFMSGFGSEAVLRKMRDVSDSIRAWSAGDMAAGRATSSGALYGEIRKQGAAARGVEVKVADLGMATMTDDDGLYILRKVPVGEQRVMVGGKWYPKPVCIVPDDATPLVIKMEELLELPATGTPGEAPAGAPGAPGGCRPSVLEPPDAVPAGPGPNPSLH